MIQHHRAEATFLDSSTAFDYRFERQEHVKILQVTLNSHDATPTGFDIMIVEAY